MSIHTFDINMAVFDGCFSPHPIDAALPLKLVDVSLMHAYLTLGVSPDLPRDQLRNAFLSKGFSFRKYQDIFDPAFVGWFLVHRAEDIQRAYETFDMDLLAGIFENEYLEWEITGLVATLTKNGFDPVHIPWLASFRYNLFRALGFALFYQGSGPVALSGPLEWIYDAVANDAETDKEKHKRTKAYIKGVTKMSLGELSAHPCREFAFIVLNEYAQTLTHPPRKTPQATRKRSSEEDTETDDEFALMEEAQHYYKISRQ